MLLIFIQYHYFYDIHDYFFITCIINLCCSLSFSPLGRTLPRIHSHKSASLPARGKDADMPPVLDLLRVAPEDLATQITRMDFPVFKCVKFGGCFCYLYYWHYYFSHCSSLTHWPWDDVVSKLAFLKFGAHRWHHKCPATKESIRWPY